MVKPNFAEVAVDIVFCVISWNVYYLMSTFTDLVYSKQSKNLKGCYFSLLDGVRLV